MNSTFQQEDSTISLIPVKLFVPTPHDNMSGIGSAPHPNTTRGERGRIPAHEVHELRKYRKRALTHSAAKRARIDQEIDDVQFFEEGLESELDGADMGSI